MAALCSSLEAEDLLARGHADQNLRPIYSRYAYLPALRFAVYVFIGLQKACCCPKGASGVGLCLRSPLYEWRSLMTEVRLRCRGSRKRGRSVELTTPERRRIGKGEGCDIDSLQRSLSARLGWESMSRTVSFHSMERAFSYGELFFTETAVSECTFWIAGRPDLTAVVSSCRSLCFESCRSRSSR